jgi:DmsE family decaheme c-type cytochrome
VRNNRAIILLVLLSLLLLSLGTASGKTKEQTTKPPDTSTPSANGYVGADTCKTCHEDQFKNYNEGAHWRADKTPHPDVPGQACETCHGPGQAHVEGGGDVTKIRRFETLKAGEASKVCLGCHENSAEHNNFTRSQHLKNEVGCTDCHSVHHPKTTESLLKAKQPVLCYTCHLEAKPDFSKPFHHRVNEGLIKCTDCHNPHGGFLTRQLRSTAAQDQVCFKCHSEKAGPFVWEHAPVKTEGCVACHTPHGSTNPRLLKRANINLLCLECHTLTVDAPAPAAPSFHNQAQKYQACTLCHTQIHGSNFSRVFFQ